MHDIIKNVILSNTLYYQIRYIIKYVQSNSLAFLAIVCDSAGTSVMSLLLVLYKMSKKYSPTGRPYP